MYSCQLILHLYPAPCYSEWSLQTSSVNMTQELVQDADSGLAPDLLRRTCRVMRSPGDSHEGCTALLDVITLKQGLSDFWIMNNSTVRNTYYSVCIDVAETGFYKTLLTLPTCAYFSVPFVSDPIPPPSISSCYSFLEVQFIYCQHHPFSMNSSHLCGCAALSTIKC